jgi:hypothetical protein
VGWRISDENFLKDLTFISDLKLRAGYGKVGNDQIDANNQFSFFRSDPARSFYDINGSNTSTTPGYDLDRKGNPGSKWEETATLNLGLDLSLLISITKKPPTFLFKFQDPEPKATLVPLL